MVAGVILMQADLGLSLFSPNGHPNKLTKRNEPEGWLTSSSFQSSSMQVPAIFGNTRSLLRDKYMVDQKV
jgi:hypothetical protein